MTRREQVVLIWSEEHGAWWRPNRAGYTTSMAKAGRYPPHEAHSIVHSANGGGTFCEIVVLYPFGLDRLSQLPSGGR